MFFVNINLVVVVVAAIISMIIGFIWYSPWVFGKAWMKAIGVVPGPEADAKKKGMWKTFLLSFLLTIVTSFIIAVVVNSVFTMDIVAALITGLTLSIGFVVSIRLNDKLFSPTSWSVFLISTGYYTVSVVVMTTVITLFS
jgi:hypothetical protein